MRRKDSLRVYVTEDQLYGLKVLSSKLGVSMSTTVVSLIVEALEKLNPDDVELNINNLVTELNLQKLKEKHRRQRNKRYLFQNGMNNILFLAGSMFIRTGKLNMKNITKYFNEVLQEYDFFDDETKEILKKERESFLKYGDENFLVHVLRQKQRGGLIDVSKRKKIL